MPLPPPESNLIFKSGWAYNLDVTGRKTRKSRTFTHELMLSTPSGKIKYNQSSPYSTEVPDSFGERKTEGSVFIFESVPKMNQTSQVELKILDSDDMLALHVILDIGSKETKASGTNDYIVTSRNEAN